MGHVININIDQDQVNLALTQVREFILSDGGDLEIVKIEDLKIYIKLKGACVSCPLSFYTVQMGIIKTLKEYFQQDIDVILVD